jgi:hypothetical protein
MICGDFALVTTRPPLVAQFTVVMLGPAPKKIQ